MRTTLNSDVWAPRVALSSSEPGAPSLSFAGGSSVTSGIGAARVANGTAISSAVLGARNASSIAASCSPGKRETQQSRFARYASVPALATKPSSVMLIGMGAKHTHPALRLE